MNSLIGTKIGHYRIDALIARGGMGAVYRATNLRIDRVVAIKLLHPHRFQDSESHHRFLREARAAANLNHPSIVRVFDFQHTDKHVFLVMELIEGVTLSTKLRRLRQTGVMENLHENLLALAQVADALDYAHQMGIVHRDIKPGNILLKAIDPPPRAGDPPFRAVVTDFGLAKFQHAQERQSDYFSGTLPYMSPEQCVGGAVDGRSDIYSLGIVLYQMTTGQLPFAVKTNSTAIQAHLHETPTPPRVRQPALPPAVEAIIFRALAKQPIDRYHTADQMAAALREAADALTDAAITQLSSANWEETTQHPGLIQEAAQDVAAAETTILPVAQFETERLTSANALSLHINPVNIHVTPGEKGSVQIEIANLGLSVDHFVIQLRQLPASWVRLAQSSVQLMPGARASFPLTIHPPADSRSTVGEHPYELLLLPAHNATLSAAVKGRLIIRPFARLQMSAHPTHFNNSGVCRIQIKNEGNTAVSYRITGRDAANAILFDGTNQQLRITAGNTESLIMGIRPRKRPWFGTAHAYPFDLELHTNKGETVVESGRILIHPRIARWVIPLLLIGFILVGFLVVTAALTKKAQANATAAAQEAVNAAQTTTRQFVQAQQSIGGTATAVSQQHAIATTTAIAATAVAQSDEDGDGLSFQTEQEIGTNPNDPDSDADQLLDGQEVNQYGTNPLNSDTDGDGLDDYKELFVCETAPTNPDTDNDGVIDGLDSHPLLWPTATPLPSTTLQHAGES